MLNNKTTMHLRLVIFLMLVLERYACYIIKDALGIQLELTNEWQNIGWWNINLRMNYWILWPAKCNAKQECWWHIIHIVIQMMKEEDLNVPYNLDAKHVPCQQIRRSSSVLLWQVTEIYGSAVSNLPIKPNQMLR